MGGERGPSPEEMGLKPRDIKITPDSSDGHTRNDKPAHDIRGTFTREEDSLLARHQRAQEALDTLLTQFGRTDQEGHCRHRGPLQGRDKADVHRRKRRV